MVVKPILFSTPMVQAILDGRKTQTRRIIKGVEDCYFQSLVLHASGKFTFVRNGNYTPTNDDVIEKKPQYQKGDVLWVRETWKPGSWREDGRVAFDYKATPELTETPWVYPKDFETYFQRWTDEILKNGSEPDADGFHHWESGQSPLSWKPSIHMPKEAARIFLEITDVRCERLQDISEEDAIAEGVELVERGKGMTYKSYISPNRFFLFAEQSFKTLWQSINGLESWDSNPFVWVYEFKQVEKPSDS